MTGLVLPLGHYLGRYHPQAHAPVRHHKVRLGRNLVRLGDHAFAMWLRCHGHRTRREVLDASRELPDPERLLDSLIDEGIVAAVVPGTGDAVRFAGTHRIQPLMTGLGNSAREPHRFGIGPLGGPPAVTVDAVDFEVWQWGRLERDLWQVVLRLVAVEDRVHPARNATPEDILTELLQRLPVLLTHHAAYLDLA